MVLFNLFNPEFVIIDNTTSWNTKYHLLSFILVLYRKPKIQSSSDRLRIRNHRWNRRKSSMRANKLMNKKQWPSFNFSDLPKNLITSSSRSEPLPLWPWVLLYQLSPFSGVIWQTPLAQEETLWLRPQSKSCISSFTLVWECLSPVGSCSPAGWSLAKGKASPAERLTSSRCSGSKLVGSIWSTSLNWPQNSPLTASPSVEPSVKKYLQSSWLLACLSPDLPSHFPRGGFSL